MNLTLCPLLSLPMNRDCPECEDSESGERLHCESTEVDEFLIAVRVIAMLLYLPWHGRGQRQPFVLVCILHMNPHKRDFC